MINQSAGYYPHRGVPGTTSGVTIASDPMSGGYTYTTYNTRTVHMNPRVWRRGCALYLLIAGIALTVFGIMPLIAGAVILSTVSFGGIGGVVPLVFGFVILCVGVSLLIASCCVAKTTPADQSTTGNLNTFPGQTAAGQGFGAQYPQPGAYGQNPPTYTGLNQQHPPTYPPAYPPSFGQYPQPSQGILAEQYPSQYEGSSATPYQPPPDQFAKPYQQ